MGENGDVERDVGEREHGRAGNRAAGAQMVGMKDEPHPRAHRADRLDFMRPRGP